MDVREIAADMVAMTKAGDFHIGEKYWADDVISIEAMDGSMAWIEGKAAAQGKTDWWNNAHEIHGTETFGPFVNGDQIAIHWKIDVTNKDSGQRMQMDEVALYTIKNGKIAEERFLY